MRRLLATSFGLLLIIGSPRGGWAQTHVAGTVVDSTDEMPVPRATIRVEGAYAGTAADDEGHFALEVPEGAGRLRIGAVGYATTVRPIPSRRDSAGMTVRLAPRSVPLGHVTVTAEGPGSEASPSRYVLRPVSVKQVPALGEPDVIRAAASLPGVAQPNDIDTRLNVRGGSSDQNQFLLDGIEIYNPSHLYGLFGAFNPYVTGETTVYAASFPARCGGRLSSVIDVGTRVPPDSGYTRANLSLVSLSGAHAQKWGKTGVVVGGRRTYLDPVLAAVGGPEDTSMGYHFLDTNVKIRHALSDRISVTGFGFFQRDDLSVTGGEGPFNGEESETNANETFTTWGNALGALRLRARHGAFEHEATGSFIRTKTDVELSSLTMENVLRDLTVQYDGALTWRRTRIQFGGQGKRRTFNYGWSGSREELSNVLYGGLGTKDAAINVPAAFSTDETRLLYAGHATVERRLFGDPLTLRAGVRVGGLDGAAAVWQPRFRATVQATSALRVHASAGRYAQYVATGFEGQEFNVTEPLVPLDQPQTAWTITTGATAKLGTRYRVRAVAYARFLNRFPRLHEESEPSSGPRLPFRYGTARALGLDVLAEKTRGWITGQLAYAFGHVRTKFGGRRFPPSWSIPHSLRATLGLRMGKWEIQTSGHAHSGLPFTPAIGRIQGLTEELNGLEDRYLLGERNSERLPPYIRVDLALRRTYHTERFDWTLYVQALNLLNRRNPLRIDQSEFYAFGIDNSAGEQQGAQRSLPIIPTVGIEFAF